MAVALRKLSEMPGLRLRLFPKLAWWTALTQPVHCLGTVILTGITAMTAYNAYATTNMT